MADRATFALKAGVWFRRGRLLIVSPDSLGTACPLSGRNSTYRPVQILEASSTYRPAKKRLCQHHSLARYSRQHRDSIPSALVKLNALEVRVSPCTGNQGWVGRVGSRTNFRYMD